MTVNKDNTYRMGLLRGLNKLLYVNYIYFGYYYYRKIHFR